MVYCLHNVPLPPVRISSILWRPKYGPARVKKGLRDSFLLLDIPRIPVARPLARQLLKDEPEQGSVHLSWLFVLSEMARLYGDFGQVAARLPHRLREARRLGLAYEIPGGVNEQDGLRELAAARRLAVVLAVSLVVQVVRRACPEPCLYGVRDERVEHVGREVRRP